MSDAARLACAIERYRSAFWARRQALRPPVAVAPPRNWMPIQFLREPFPRGYLAPSDVTPTLARNEYEDMRLDRPVYFDDWIPYAAIWRGVPWLEAICGCPIRVAEGALAPEHWVPSAGALREVELPASAEWLARYEGRTRELVAEVPEDCCMSPTILRGPSDVLNAMRGSAFFLDLYDDPPAVRAAAERVNQLLVDVLRRHFALAPVRMGGYGNYYGYWAPGPTVAIQEDALGLCAPKVYRELFAALSREAVRQLGPYVFFHLHATGFRHYRDVLAIPGLAGLELTVEQNGPDLLQLEPVLREVLERTRLILFVDAHFEDLSQVLRRLPCAGLYVLLADRFVPDQAALAQFLSAAYPGSRGR